VTGRSNISRLSRREVNNDVWKYLQNIVMGLHAVCEQKHAYPGLVLSQCMKAKVNHLYEQNKDMSTGKRETHQYIGQHVCVVLVLLFVARYRSHETVALSV